VSNFVRFWIVWSPTGSRPPSHRHATEAAARNEADRLARAIPGAEFFVLEAKGCARKVEVQWSEAVEPAEMPF